MDFINRIDEFTLIRTIPIPSIKDMLDKSLMRVSRYIKDEIIHLEGAACNNLEVIISGKTVVERITESGDLLTIAEFISDDILGGNLIFSKVPNYPMTVTAKTQTTILEIHKDVLLDLCFNNKPFLKVFLQLTSDHTLLLGDKIKHYVNRTIKESISAYLKNEYKLQKSFKIILSTNKRVLAERIGVPRTSLSRELKKMKDDGLLDFDRKSITILQPSITK